MTGLKIRDTDDSHVRLESESYQLVVLQAPKHITEAIEINEPLLRRENTPIKLVFFVENIDKVREVAQNPGGAIESIEKEWMFGADKVCDGYDPEGNVFQVSTSAV